MEILSKHTCSNLPPVILGITTSLVINKIIFLVTIKLDIPCLRRPYPLCCHKRREANIGLTLRWTLRIINRHRVFSKGPIYVSKGPICVNKGPIYVNKGLIYVNKGPIYVTKGPIYVTKGPECKLQILDNKPLETGLECRPSNTGLSKG